MAPAKCCDFDIAISYACENSKQAKTVAAPLKRQHVSTFDDRYKQALLWEEDLSIRFADRYQNIARYGVIFCSKQNVTNLWTTYTAAQRCTKQKNQASISPVQLDDIEILSFLLLIVSLRLLPENVATIITTAMRKLSRTTNKPPFLNTISQDIPATTSQLDVLTIICSRHGKAGKGWEAIVVETSLKNS